jgi:SAM-dependent methyltransferase
VDRRQQVALAVEGGVDTTLHQDDEMYNGNLDVYLAVGRSAIHVIDTALKATQSPDPASILDLPCGHGRVMRHLRHRFPDARIVGCDLLRSGVDFCAKQYGATGIYSTKDPATIPVEGTFDLIWVGSLLTHLDAPLWRPFLDFFTSKLSPSGLLIFTVGGRYNTRRRQTIPSVAEGFDRDGFGYWERSGDGYGTAYASRPWVMSLLNEYPNRLISYWERGWNDGQDVAILSGVSVFAPQTANFRSTNT